MVRIKRVGASCYEVIEIPDYIEKEIWGSCVVVGEKSGRTEHFHKSWISKVEEVCRKNGIDFLIQA